MYRSSGVFMVKQEFSEIGKRFKIIRKRMGLTQVKMANLLGISQPNYSYYENGVSLPPTDLIVRMSKACSSSADYILGLTSVDYHWLTESLSTGNAAISSVDGGYMLNVKGQNDEIDLLIG